MSQTRYYCLDLPVEHWGTWQLSTLDHRGRPCAPHLHSRGLGEAGTGVLRSPVFTLTAPEITLQLRGYCRHFQPEPNRVELIDAETGAVLETAYPPDDIAEERVETRRWDTRPHRGRRVQFRLVDCDDNFFTAWLGVDALDASPDFSQSFDGPESLRGWRVERPAPELQSLHGVPFLRGEESPLAEDRAFSLPVGTTAACVLLAGMTPPSPGQGAAGRCALGQRLGDLLLRYADGTEDAYPLLVGEGLWWGKEFALYPEPFASFTGAAEALRQALRLYPPAPNLEGAYLACIQTRPGQTLASLAYRPVQGPLPIITGVTLMEPGPVSAPGQWAEGTEPVPELERFLAERSLRRAGEGEAAAQQAIAGVRALMYVSAADLPDLPVPDLPLGYAGPRVQFFGDRYARFFSSVFAHNALDMAAKVGADGVFHTSSSDAPWYGYCGIGGTFVLPATVNPARQGQRPWHAPGVCGRDDAGNYYDEAWTRDLGRTLMELLSLGHLDQARACADWCLEQARVWETEPRLAVQGRQLPRHICRILQLPTPELGDGFLENDGHGMVALFLYNLWRRLPDRDAWLRARWEDVRALGDWIPWQFRHPEISRADELLWSDSEAANYCVTAGKSFYCDMACIEALLALAVMADSLGEGESAGLWRQTAARMLEACDRVYGQTLPDGSRRWGDEHLAWQRHSQLSALLLNDRFGLFPENGYPRWAGMNEEEFAGYGLGQLGGALGYDASFLTQAALLLDRLEDAGELMRRNALYIYSPVYKPYIIPEACTSVGGGYFTRAGDLGNAVQQAEMMKCLRLIVGMDDSQPGVLGLIPRLPQGWTGYDVRELPAWVDGKRQALSLRYTLEEGCARLRLRSDAPLPELCLRVGPFPLGAALAATLDGAAVPLRTEVAGDGQWARLSCPGGAARRSVAVKIR